MADSPPEQAAELQQRLPRHLTVLLGVVVVVAFGSWFYGYGVLVTPIAEDTGWSEGTLATAYGVGLLFSGFAAVVSGRVIDGSGPRTVFLVAAVGVAAGTAVTASAPSAPVFVLAAIATQSVVGAAGYYTAVHATIARLVPAARTRAITTNTLWGAFASPVFLPLMALLAQQWGWRWTVAATGCLVVAAFSAAGALLPSVPADEGAARVGLLAGLVAAGRDGVVRRLLVTAACGGVVCSMLFLYQVPAMVTAGLALATASTLAGLRGLFQLAGRLPLPWLVARVGSLPLYRGSLVVIGLSSLLLLASGQVLVAVVFAVVAGVAVGMFSTLESIATTQLVDIRAVGLVLGAYGLARGIGSAIGPTAAGLLTDVTGTRLAALAAGAVVAVLGALSVPSRSTTATGPAAG